MRVLGITGSLRRDSYNHALLREAAERLPAGTEWSEFDRLGEIPPYDPEVEEMGTPEPVEALRQAMREPTRSSSPPPSTTTRSRAFSRTPSTGPPAPPAKAPSRASRRW